MEALLGASGYGLQSVTSVDDLRQQFHDLFEPKVSATRVEHVSAGFKFRTDAVFHLAVSDAEHEALDAASRLDPSLASAGAPQALGGGQFLHHVKSSDATDGRP